MGYQQFRTALHVAIVVGCVGTPSYGQTIRSQIAGTVTKDLLEQLPTNRNFQDVYVVVGGMQIAGPPLTGGGGQRETGANNTPKTYGQLLQTNSVFEGLVVQSNEIPNFSSFDEVDVK